jgi:hypothetical protein
MSLSVTIFSLEPSQAEAYEAAFLRVMGQAATRQVVIPSGADPDEWTDVGVEREDLLPEDLLEKAEPSITLPWEAFGLSFLLSGAAALAYEPGSLIEPVFGRELGVGLNPDDSVHNRVLLRPEEVTQAAAFLERFEPSAVRARFDPAALREGAVSPLEKWPEAGAAEALGSAFEQLRDFYRQARAEGRWLVTEVVV